MRFTKVIVAAAFVFTMAAGALLAADDSFSYGGYGRIGTAFNGHLAGASDDSAVSSRRGRLGAEAETNYFEQAFSKKWTADGGAWAKMTFCMGYWNGSVDGDNVSEGWETRQFYSEMGGLSILPAGATIWAGLRYYGRKDVHNFDLFYTNFSGSGFGLENLANGMFSIAYIGQGTGTNIAEFGEVKLHNVVATIKVPSIATIDAAFGYAKADKDKTIGAANGIFVSVLLTPPVMGLNIVAQYGKGVYSNPSDSGSIVKQGTFNLDETTQKSVNKMYFYRLIAHTATDIQEGVTLNPAVLYQSNVNPDGKQTDNELDAFLRAVVKLNQNLAFQGNVGVSYTFSQGSGYSSDQKKGVTKIQITPALVVALDPGYWTRPQIRFWMTVAKISGGATGTAFTNGYEGKKTAVYGGCQMEAWW